MTAIDSITADYEASLAVDAPPNQVLTALATADGIGSWWTAWSTVIATPDQGGTLRFRFKDDTDQLVVHVETPDKTHVAWTVLDCAVLPDGWEPPRHSPCAREPMAAPTSHSATTASAQPSCATTPARPAGTSTCPA